MDNILLDTDSYKASHWKQYPPKTTSLFSYLESRGGKYHSTLFFGLQYILEKYLSKPITLEQVEEAKAFFDAHGEPFPYDGFKYIVEKLNGKIPVRIRAVPEGSIVPTHNVLMTVESTDKNVPWVVSYFETLLMRVWYPITVATQSFYIKQDILKYLTETSDDPKSEIAFKLHDFGARGVSSQESAGIGGAAHLVNFMGSDTVAGVWLANKFYHSNMAGFSIPAAEHSSITSWGKENEVAAYRNMLTQFAKPGALVAVVSDSYDLENACRNLWGDKLKDEVVKSGATVVIRPDSGDPSTVVLQTLKTLSEKFGTTVNTKGFKVLKNVRVIQGDGINQESINKILSTAKDAGFSASNIAFGMGGALLQQVNRDTQRFAYKCSSITVDGKERDVFKDPITDPGKKSKPGRLDLVKGGMGYGSIVLESLKLSHPDTALVTVFENGKILKEHTLDEIRARANGN